MNGLRKYRIHLFDGADYELLTDQTHAITLDLDGPAWESQLAARLPGLIAQAHAAGDTVAAPRLELRDWLTGAKVMDWAAPC